MSKEIFPRCHLRNTRVVEGFPSECALAKPNSVDALLDLKNPTFWSGYGGPYAYVATENVWAERKLRKVGI